MAAQASEDERGPLERCGLAPSDRAGKRLVHVGFPSEPLDVWIPADADEALASLVVAVPEILHHSENPEHAPVSRMKPFAPAAARGHRRSRTPSRPPPPPAVLQASRSRSLRRKLGRQLLPRLRLEGRRVRCPNGAEVSSGLALPPAGSSWRSEVPSANASPQRTSSAKSPFSHYPNRRSSCRRAGRSMRRNRATVSPGSVSHSELS